MARSAPVTPPSPSGAAAELAELLAVARQAARVARDVILPIYGDRFAVELKADRTPVTIADRRAEEAMRAFFAHETPGFGVVGEEHGETPGDGRHRWIVDPIDGTKSFVHRVPLWGTLVALERDGVPVVGVISCPAAGETVYAAAGHGAFDEQGRRLRVSTVAVLAEAAVSMSSFSSLAARHPAAFTRLLSSARLLRTWGDCFGYLLLATGRIDAMLDPQMNLWDVAAILPVVTEAGGRVTTWEGDDRAGASCVASNGIVHPELLRVLHGER